MPFKPIGRAEKGLLAIISFALSLMLWLQVNAQTQPTRQREFLVRLEAKGLQPGLFLSDLPEGVSVVADGPETEIDDIEPSDLIAVVDVSNKQPGSYTVKVMVPAVVDKVMLRPKRPVLKVSIDKVATTIRTVSVETQGMLDGFKNAVAEPAVITLTGPAGEIGKVSRVRALVDVSRGMSQTVDLEALGADGVPLPRVEVSPRVVLVRIEVAPSSL
ncbi:MAG: hypothetical protein JNK63_05185 [Chthonomonas sp.]|nr:hypothetical protein [Chthonomonas sp.]